VSSSLWLLISAHTPYIHTFQYPLANNMATNPPRIFTPNHEAIVTVGIKAPLESLRVPTIHPTGSQVRVHVEWTASTPLDLHQNDGGLLVQHPQVLGDGTAGTVIDVGSEVKRLKMGDKVFGFMWRNQAEKAHQQFCTTDEWLLAKVLASCPRLIHGY
jgi:NADPH:quinone reductase-like Zn-dependent oxidoreductase